MKYDPLHILCSNGWVWLCCGEDFLSNTDELDQYKAEFLGASYSSTVVALVSRLPDHLKLDGHYGIMWLEAVYEIDRNNCYAYDDMEDMQCAIIKAEENLLKIGMPFTQDYCFHGKNIANKKRRNDKLRRLYKLAELEAEDGA